MPKAKFKLMHSLRATPLKWVTKEVAMELEQCPHLFLTDKYPPGITQNKRELGFIGVYVGDELFPCVRIIIEKEQSANLINTDLYPK